MTNWRATKRPDRRVARTLAVSIAVIGILVAWPFWPMLYSSFMGWWTGKGNAQSGGIGAVSAGISEIIVEALVIAIAVFVVLKLTKRN